jgi:hypothetical protein
MMAVKADLIIAAPTKDIFEYVRDNETKMESRSDYVEESVSGKFATMSAYTQLPFPLTNRQCRYGVWKYEKMDGNCWAVIAESLVPSPSVKGYITSIVHCMCNCSFEIDLI